MKQPLKVLMIEDSVYDMRLIIRELKKGNFEPEWERIETAEEFNAQLTEQIWDVIISDYSLPQFGAPAALEIVKKHSIDIPFIVASGVIGESSAVEMMRAGAHDYVMKDNLTRLPEAIRRELREARLRSERQQTEKVMKLQLAAMEAAIDGIAILKDDVYLYVNRSHLELFGYEYSDELIGQNWQSHSSSSEMEQFEQEIIPALEKHKAWQGEVIANRKNNSTIYLGVSYTLTEEGTLISICRDITDLKQAQNQIIHNAFHDPLTDLPNRKLLMESLERSIERMNRNKNYQYAVLFLDLDRFKVINDSLGHGIGDQLLQAVANKLVSHIRTGDTVARLGGDEFIILLDDIENRQSVVTVVERILTDCQKPILIESHSIFLSFSIGIVLGTAAYQLASDLIRDADTAMYRAKAQEHPSFRFFDREMHAAALDRLILEGDLRKALINKEFLVYYQPIIDLGSNQLHGFEALARWQHPIRGLVSPNEFISIAEETGLILTLDTLISHQACQQMEHWKRKFPHFANLNISINLSVQDILNPNFIVSIEKVLEETKIEGKSITFEITESMLIDDIEQTLEVITQLDTRGIKISIDDFGTGYSSLQYLHRLPADYLKIDQSFVSQMNQEGRNFQVVNTIITLGNQIGLKTVAEGIETLSTATLIQEMGCNFGQGYYYSKPLSAIEIENRFCHHAVL